MAHQPPDRLMHCHMFEKWGLGADLPPVCHTCQILFDLLFLNFSVLLPLHCFPRPLHLYTHTYTHQNPFSSPFLSTIPVLRTMIHSTSHSPPPAQSSFRSSILSIEKHTVVELVDKLVGWRHCYYLLNGGLEQNAPNVPSYLGIN